MGITTKIWAATDAELARCLEEPARVGYLFVRCEDYAMIHDSRALEHLLRRLAGRRRAVGEVPRASDPSFVMTPGAVAAMRDDEELREILAFASVCSNGVQIPELVQRAVAAERGLVFCVYEDW